MLPIALALGSLALNSVGDLMGASAQNRNAARNKSAAIASETNQINDVNLRQTQEQQAASQELVAAQRQTRTALSSARLSSGEAGVSGNSVDALLTDIGAQSSTYTQDVKLNEAQRLAQLDSTKTGIYAQTQDRINSVQPANPWATALRIGGSAVGTLASLQSRVPPSDGAPSAGAAAASVASNLRIGAKAAPRLTFPTHL